MKSILQLIVVMLLVSLTASAQTFQLEGTVIDETGLPLPGTSILNQSSQIGTQSDFDGNYVLPVKVGDTISFTYVGFTTESHIISKPDQRLDVKLKFDQSQLDEVVVVAQGIKKERKSLGYSVSSVRSENSGLRTAGDVARVLSGKTSGVQISGQSGTSGSASNVLIRGYGSITGNQSPLVVVDGVPVQIKHEDINNLKKGQGSIGSVLDPSNIQNVNTLTGLAAASLYGSAAHNGVIVITTKSGDGGQLLPPMPNNETYARIKENTYKNVVTAPLSTFSIDVDKAGYSNVRRMINNGQTIPPDAVKLEEMINYFDYDYPQPQKDEAFSITTDIADSPWNQEAKLVRIGLKGKELAPDYAPASNLVFLIDVSGSMDGPNKLPLVKKSLQLLVRKLRPIDRVSMVVYAGAAGVVLEPTAGNEKELINQALDRLEAGGSTAGGAGIELAYKLAEQHFVKDGNNRVVLATDGDFNVGASSDRAMEDLIVDKRNSGVFLTVLGYGMGNYKDSKMEILADKGNGNHAYIDGMQEANRVMGEDLMGTMYTIAKDVKIQVEFNPAKVRAYRLVGYENRLLADEDFKDDTKDAGELGSGHTVTALYEVIPHGIESDYVPQMESLKYKTPVIASSGKEWLTVRFRYKEPDGDTSKLIVHTLSGEPIPFMQASPDFRFAASVALFGMQLRKSLYIKELNRKKVVELASNAMNSDSRGYRAEFIRLVESYQ